MRMLRRMLIRIVAAALLSYLIVAGMIAWRQRDLLYYPQYTRADPAATNYSLQRPDAVLRGWRVRPGRARALLYFGGNAEAVQHLREPFARWFPHHTTYLVAYRGYGASDGTPEETALLLDAVALYDAVAAQHDAVDVLGRSLGSGIATWVAAERPVRKLALITPYDSIAAVARDAFPLMPVDWLLRDRFDAWKYASRARAEVLLVIAGRDNVIGAARSEALAAAFPHPPQRLVLPASGHDDVQQDPRFERRLREFLQPPDAAAGQR